MALSKKQVAFLCDLEYDTTQEVIRFIEIIKKWYKTLDNYQCFHELDDWRQVQEDFDFMMTMLGAK